MKKRFDLNEGWEFKASEADHKKSKINSWHRAEVPGTIHTDLLSHKLIDEPFYDDNELKLGWVAEADWDYRINFNKPANFNDKNHAFLIFDGIDTAAEIFLNETKLAGVSNMFLKHEFDISSNLKENGNILEIKFQSPVKYAQALEKKYGKLPVALNSERVYIRKAQYSFGWDWGPSFPTMGIWRPVYLEQRSKILINNVFFSTKKISNDKASVEVRVQLSDNPSRDSHLRITTSYMEEHFEKIIQSNSSESIIDFEIVNPKLWWPSGEGEQNLYDLKIELIKNEEVIDIISKKVGIRTVRLDLIENEKHTFKIVVNNKAVYSKGVNWIPADSFLPRVTEEKYRTLLQYAIDANMNIVRVWGGGIYENDIFYNLCDELGLLVWQDFMFACASYPEHEDFISSVEEEVKQNVQRLYNHPSIAVWCGNNENEWIWHQEMKVSYKRMPGYQIYHVIIPRILKEIDSSIVYWPSSPFGFDEDPNSHSSGNRHEWGIWSKWIDPSEVKNDESLFVTEFGFQGPADKKTFERFISKEKWNVQDPVFEFHNKQVEGPERIFRFLAGNLPIKTEWEDFIYLAQLNQALALKTCLEHWRFNWPTTNGSIIWQINDCWPVTSWAIIDSELRPKLAYFFVKNIFNQVALTIFEAENSLQIIGINQTNKDADLKISLKIFDDEKGDLIFEKTVDHKIKTWRKESIINFSQTEIGAENKFTLIASLYDEENKMIFRNFYSASKWKHKTLAKPEFKINKESYKIILSANKPAYFIDLFHPDADFGDKGFILLPGEEKEVKYKSGSVQKEEVKILMLNNYLDNK